MRLLTTDEHPLIYVDGDLLPPYMGIRLAEDHDTLLDQMVSVLFSNTYRRHQSFQTWLTRLVLRGGVPWKYIDVCRLYGVRVEVHYEGRVLHFEA